MTATTDKRSITILLVEDNPGDVLLTQEALADCRVVNEIKVASDGIEALEILNSSSGRPDLILLDLNMPRMDGREVLARLKVDPDLRRIPVVVMTTSKAEADIVRSYDLHANCYITKPVDFEKFITVIQQIQVFWLDVVTLAPVQ